jgi:hypothetical protein
MAYTVALSAKYVTPPTTAGGTFSALGISPFFPVGRRTFQRSVPVSESAAQQAPWPFTSLVLKNRVPSTAVKGDDSAIPTSNRQRSVPSSAESATRSVPTAYTVSPTTVGACSNPRTCVVQRTSRLSVSKAVIFPETSPT